MKNIADGYAYITAGGHSYELAPSFCNMAKIGSPMEIISVFKRIASPTNFVTSYADACNVLECCGLPRELIGGLRFSEKQMKTLISPGLLPIEDVYNLALHCLKHGVCGTNEQIKEHTKGDTPKPMEEFDPYVYVVSAMDHLAMSANDAESLTMTRYIRLISAKIKVADQAERSKEPTEEEQQKAFSQYELLKMRAEERARNKSKG